MACSLSAQAGPAAHGATWLPQRTRALGETHDLGSLASPGLVGMKVPTESKEHGERLNPGTPQPRFRYAADATARCAASPPSPRVRSGDSAPVGFHCPCTSGQRPAHSVLCSAKLATLKQTCTNRLFRPASWHLVAPHSCQRSGLLQEGTPRGAGVLFPEMGPKAPGGGYRERAGN